MSNAVFMESPSEDQKMIWMAAYNNNTFLSEYSYDTKAKNDFNSIDKDNLIRFGLIGYSMNMYFEVRGGAFKIVGRMYEVIYKDKDTNVEYYLTGHPMTMYSDIIQYKTADSTFDALTGETTNSGILQYNFGYKQTLDIDDVQFNYKAICSLPTTGKPIFLNIRLVSDRAFNNGSIIIRKNSEEIFEFYAPMEANVAYEMNWEMV
jgi:hypothetical protein